MASIKAVGKNGRWKISVKGDIASLLALHAAIGKALSEKLAKERHMSLQAAEETVRDCFKDGMEFIQKENQGE